LSKDAMARNVYRYKNRLNVVGENILRLRTSKGWSQRFLADRMQEYDLQITKNAIQTMENGSRCVKDLEVLLLSKIFEVDLNELYKNVKIELNQDLTFSSINKNSEYSKDSEGYGVGSVADSHK
jgi:transcriptional regulator with XRE-family HTH domain